jgi:hypothetical protein
MANRPRSGKAGRQKHVPQRTCVVCRQVRNKRELVRVVRTPDRELVIDETGKLNVPVPAGRLLGSRPKGKPIEQGAQDGYWGTRERHTGTLVTHTFVKG